MDLDDFGTDVCEDRENDVCEKEEVNGIYFREDTLSGDICQWQILPNNSYTSSSSTVKKIKAGIYDISIDSYGKFYFNLKNIISDSFIYFEDSQLDHILKDINIFWDIKDKFSKFGFVHRRGILLYGPAGGGKSILIKQAIHQIIKQEGIVIDSTNCRPDFISEAVKIFRKIEPKRNLIVIFEDIDAYIQRYGEPELLSFLDGEDSFDHLLCIATTNYPEKLDKRIVSRPRRFDRIIKIDMPTAQMREVYFKTKLSINGEELQKYVDNTKGFTFAAMTELVISTKCFDMEFDEAIKLLKSILANKTTSNEYYQENKVGFGK